MICGYWLLFVSLLLGGAFGAKKSTTKKKSLEDLDYRVFPRRTVEEAAVLEWGHSAIISALDASVAYFGPQTSQAALLEVECQPVMADPLGGLDDNEDGTQFIGLKNADEVHGNMVVMSNQNLTGWELAILAKNSGAAALLVVNIDHDHPDDIYCLTKPTPKDLEQSTYLSLSSSTQEEVVAMVDEMDIPVVMISYTSATVLTSATISAGTAPENIVNNGMPDRVRLYAGGDRPFFEDVEAQDPMLYLIHQLLTLEECDDLLRQATSRITENSSKMEDSLLEYTTQTEKMHLVDRVVLWRGYYQTSSAKVIEERIDQVTGFPPAHFTDFLVDRYQKGSHWQPHYDTLSTTGTSAMTAIATITVFLTDGDAPVVVYPSAKEPVKIFPRKGMAIMHHNTVGNDHGQLDYSTVHAVLPVTAGENEYFYTATKHVMLEPIPVGRRLVLPLLAMFWSSLPSLVVGGHDMLVERYGEEDGTAYFDKALVFGPLLIALLMVETIRSIFFAPKNKASKSSKSPAKQSGTVSKEKKKKTNKKSNNSKKKKGE